jgi:glycosyltransferase involved in cell wall biosynthesis
LPTAAIIPVRNRPALIVDAIASIQRQTRAVDEIIVVDDASTDSTPDIVAQQSRIDNRIRLIPLPARGGASAARNVGIDSTQCDWIGFLDSDDQWMPRKHEEQLIALSKRLDAIASFTGIRYQYSNHYSDVEAPGEVTLQMLQISNRLSTTSTAMIRRDALQRVGGFDASLPSCQDWDLWIRLRTVGDFAIVSAPLVMFNQLERVRISRNKAAVLSGHQQLFARIQHSISDKRDRRLLGAYHQARLAQIYLYDFDEPANAVLAATKSLLLHRTREGKDILKNAIRASVGFLSRKQCQTSVS